MDRKINKLLILYLLAILPHSISCSFAPQVPRIRCVTGTVLFHYGSYGYTMLPRCPGELRSFYGVTVVVHFSHKVLLQDVRTECIETWTGCVAVVISDADFYGFMIVIRSMQKFLF